MSIEIFNLQLTKKGDLSSLYNNVDFVLDQAGIMKGGSSRSLVKQSIAHSLQEMIKGSHFSVCTIDKAAEVANIFISRERRNIYGLAHCIDWRDMTDEYRQSLIAMVMDDFRELFMNNNS